MCEGNGKRESRVAMWKERGTRPEQNRASTSRLLDFKSLTSILKLKITQTKSKFSLSIALSLCRTLFSLLLLSKLEEASVVVPTE